MKVVLCAYHEMGCAALESLQEVGFEVVCVFTHAGAHQENSFFDSVEAMALQQQIPVFCPDDINTPEWIAKVASLQPDALLTLSYRQALSPALIATAKKGAFNVHASLLPAYRGRAHLNWVIIRNERETGVTLHRINDVPDGGPILAQSRVAITDEDEALSLHRKLVRTTREQLPNWLRALRAGSLIERVQDENLASEPGQRKPEDGQIHWHQSADEIHALIRGVAYPWPGAYSLMGEQRFIVWKSRVITQSHQHAAGSIISIDPLYIACGENVLEIVAAGLSHHDNLSAAQLVQHFSLCVGMQLKSC
ncbi:formyltransferase family protein [Enterobacter cancerogenus]|uniref:formyltransferase family protein n=1 Tax=Enterobacter cancerogenus TaxID=69218 RepID=UPI00069184FA|nr:formyltransferase family protein [Enterobacter cancerogenus]